MEKTRLAKAIALKGYTSRRQAEELILRGYVKVDGVAINDVVTFVTPDQIIEVQGKKLANKTPKLWIYNKPRGLITTHSDPMGRETVFDAVNLGEHVISIGRLDYNSEGLLLLTNHSPFAHFAESPKNQWKRVYSVRVYGVIDEKKLDRLRRPFEIDGIRYQAFDIKRSGDKWLDITITEGKNREIRRAMESIGLEVSRLVRTQYGPFKLGDLALNKTQIVTNPEKYFPIAQSKSHE